MMLLRISLLILFPLFATGQSSFDVFYTQSNKLFQEHITEGKVNYSSLVQSKDLTDLVSFIGQANTADLSRDEKKAFRINAYNILVISQIVVRYPIASVQEVGGFFDRQKIQIEGKLMTLNSYEKDYILGTFMDPRLHFVLVCGANGCPPLSNKVFLPSNVESRIERLTKLAINDKTFIVNDNGTFQFSQIFSWYARDFGKGNTEVLNFINSYRKSEIPKETKFNYYPYDWSLNDASVTLTKDLGNNANRYIVSAAIPKNSIEIKLFNNLYSEGISNTASGSRSTYFTSSLSLLYGLTNRVNVGISTRYRFVRNDIFASNPLAVFQSENCCTTRNGLTAIGPQIRIAPFRALKNFSIQSSFTFPIGKDLEGVFYRPYIDWDGAVFNTQFFNDFSLSGNFSLFTEVDVLLEDIGFTDANSFRLSTPVTVIASYFPIRNSTIYAISGFSPYWQKNFDYFYQLGIGSKYQFSPAFEMEILYTSFRNRNLLSQSGTAATYNLGLRYSL